MLLRSQKVAAAVFEKVTDAKGQSKEYLDSYAGAAHNLPVLIRQARLCQALAFQMTREKTGAKALVNDLAKVLGHQNADEMAKKARGASLVEYIHMQTRALEALLWFKRYAVSVLKRGASVTQNQDDETEDEPTETNAGEQQ